MNEKVIAILEVFEELLDSKGIEIPCEDEGEQEERQYVENDAKIYGTEYGKLYDAIEQILSENPISFPLDVKPEMLTPTELLILAHLKKIIRGRLPNSISPSDAILYDQDSYEWAIAFIHLRELHILKKKINDDVDEYALDPRFDWINYRDRDWWDHPFGKIESEENDEV